MEVKASIAHRQLFPVMLVQLQLARMGTKRDVQNAWSIRCFKCTHVKYQESLTIKKKRKEEMHKDKSVLPFYVCVCVQITNLTCSEGSVEVLTLLQFSWFPT